MNLCQNTLNLVVEYAAGGVQETASANIKIAAAVQWLFLVQQIAKFLNGSAAGQARVFLY